MNPKVLAVVTARGGSKGVPGKNIRPVGGQALIGWTLAAARNSRHLSRTIVSTDDPQIAKVAQSLGGDVPFMRPAELARDDSSSMDAIFHAMDQLPSFSHILLLQPTSPLRNAEDIDACIEKCLSSGAPVVSVTAADKSPYWMYQLGQEGKMTPVMGAGMAEVRRQDLPQAYSLNGAVYVAEAAFLKKHKTFITAETLAHVMPKERSIDIDTELDFKFLDALLIMVNTKNGSI